jgi:cytochrome c-type biogenesis protein
MTDVFIGLASALWLGILTSISPCPLASNIAAVSFLSNKITHPALVFISGVAYTIGRMVAYVLLSWIIISSFLSLPQAAQFLQRYTSKALGPLFIITGFILLDIISFRLPKLKLSARHHNKLVESGVPGAFLLGFILALAFCPISAALYFGSLLPLTANSKNGMFMPFIYGIGTGLPVLIFAFAIALGVKSLSHWFDRVKGFEYYTRKITGVVFILVGLYYTGIYILGLF